MSTSTKQPSEKSFRLAWLAPAMLAAALLPGTLAAESCTVPSAMAPADSAALNAAALSFAARVQANDAAGVKALTIPVYAQSFDGIGSAISSTAPRIAGDTLRVTSLFLLDATALAGADTVPKDRQFFCTLSSGGDVIFSINALPPGRYAFAVVRAQSVQAAWQLSFVLQQVNNAWMLAGFVPRAAMAAGHDGLWYWTQARSYAKQNQHWNAWLFYGQADALLSPVDFMSSTNGDKLHTEQAAAQPAEIAQRGISAQSPLKAGSSAFTAIGTQVSADGKAVELAVHVAVANVSDPISMRNANQAALIELLQAYPELRTAFTAAWVYADAPGQSSFGTEFTTLPAGR